jgi:hypothetical protein
MKAKKKKEKKSTHKNEVNANPYILQWYNKGTMFGAQLTFLETFTSLICFILFTKWPDKGRLETHSGCNR